MKPLYPALPDEANATQQSTFLVLDVLRNKRLLPCHTHPLEVLVEADLIAFSDAPFGLTDTVFKESLHAFRPRAFELLGGKTFRSLLGLLSFGGVRSRVLGSAYQFSVAVLAVGAPTSLQRVVFPCRGEDSSGCAVSNSNVPA